MYIEEMAHFNFLSILLHSSDARRRLFPWHLLAPFSDGEAEKKNVLLMLTSSCVRSRPPIPWGQDEHQQQKKTLFAQ